jgi:SHS2 domain-containing protein
MNWKYKFLDHTADAAVDVTADSLEELFIASANAWRHFISDEKVKKTAYTRKVNIEESSLEILLVSFLTEINYFYQNEKWRMDSIKSLQINFENELFKLFCEIIGTEIKLLEFSDRAEIKAITYHQMNIKELERKFSTRIVFDI